MYDTQADDGEEARGNSSDKHPSSPHARNGPLTASIKQPAENTNKHSRHIYTQDLPTAAASDNPDFKYQAINTQTGTPAIWDSQSRHRRKDSSGIENMLLHLNAGM